MRKLLCWLLGHVTEVRFYLTVDAIRQANGYGSYVACRRCGEKLFG